MHFSHSVQIWDRFPQLVPGVLVVDGIQPEVKVKDYLQPHYERARARLSQGPESQMPEISAWRRVYADLGLKPTKYRSAAEALLRRFRREDNVPHLHPLVDLCNAVSLAYALPVAVFDLDQIGSYLEVRYATGREQYLAFSGELEVPPAGEVIFADAADRVHARRWTFRQSRRSIVSADTVSVLIVSEGMHKTAATDVRALVEELSQSIARLWSPPLHQVILSAAEPRLEFN